MRTSNRKWFFCALALLPAFAQNAFGQSLVGEAADEDPFNRPWQEKEVALPAYPKDESLQEFYVGPTNPNHFFIDKSSLAVGEDGVVRYVLVVRTNGGATNVTFEGIRCETAEYKTYGFGRGDGSWVRARNVDWKPIENKPVNRHHAALKAEYFCAEGIIRTAAEGIAALRRGLLR